MVIVFNGGKVIANSFDLVVRLDGAHQASLQAHVDAVQLIGRGANVISVNSGECKWSVKLDSEQQLIQLAEIMSLDIS